MNLREAAQKALEALEVWQDSLTNPSAIPGWRFSVVGEKAITALRAALADTQDWNEVEALRASLREHMAEIQRLRAAGRQALDALENHTQEAERVGRIAVGINALRATLSWDAMQRLTDVQQEMERSADAGKTLDHFPDATKMVEPAAMVTSESGNKEVTMSWWHEPALPVGTLLYFAPPKREPLTDEEIRKAVNMTIDGVTVSESVTFRAFARAIERAHGIGGKE